ncbi:pyruvate dehydrogenase complex dihydrolipoamide acetyltransferase [Thalassospiraceae bacterium LMO-SO8]|nr:pyruvate dehydrogenase complex dihydrolipoamide acetyltransferase [Alphaproteobacteria bacterium LMO-S08]WND75707.1 pyruvate dehydrogenase complex dihydrolipoamide acetyltransferase [Thalassospiraceae bacterium LMO-SO8]
MPIKILMPALSPTMTEGNLAKWHKKEGDAVESGDVLAEIETDKATMEVEAVDEGILGKIVVPEGTADVAVNAVIALLLEDGEDASALDGADTSGGAAAPAAEAAKPAPAAAPATPAAPAAAPAAASGDRVVASPLAKRIAAQEGLDLATIGGSGPRGRVVKRDVEAALAAGTGKAAPSAAAPAPSGASAPAAAPTPTQGDPVFANMPEFEAVPNSSMRKVIATRLTASARDIPHFNISIDVEIDKLLAARKDLNGRDGADYKISVNDFVIKAVAVALRRCPDVNVSYTDDAILKFKRADVSVAVAIEGGLITPIIKDAGSLGLAAISAKAKELAGKARDGKLQPEEFQGGTFTISNLGMFGVKSFNSIINPPQGGILSVGAGEQRPVVKNGALSVATVMSLTLAVDHRCIDGATAAGFAKELKAILEDPIQLLL